MEFAEFYESARDDCLRFVPLNVGERQLAEDLVAEAFTRAWMSWRKARETSGAAGMGGAHGAERTCPGGGAVAARSPWAATTWRYLRIMTTR